MTNGSMWKAETFFWRWLRWVVAGKILTTGTGILAGVALLGIEHAWWYAAGSWVLSFAARAKARTIMIEGTRAACSSCALGCPSCAAKEAGAQLSKVKIPGAGS